MGVYVSGEGHRRTSQVSANLKNINGKTLMYVVYLSQLFLELITGSCKPLTVSGKQSRGELWRP